MRKASVVAAIMAASIGLTYVGECRHAMQATEASPPSAGGHQPSTRSAPSTQAMPSARSETATARGANVPNAANAANLANVPGGAPNAATTPSGLPSVMSEAWGDGKFAGFTREELADMAGRCELRWQLPRTPDERYVTAVRALYVELTGDSDGAAKASLRALADTLRTEGDEDGAAVHQRLASRRAGDAVESTNSVSERYLQLQLDESERAKAAGAELGAKFTLSGCDPAKSLFRSTK